MSSLIPAALPADLEAGAEAADVTPDWPARSWAAVVAAGATRWAVPGPFGGSGLDPVARLGGYEDLAAACLTTAFLLSQQDAAVRLLARADGDEVRRRYLPAAARGTAPLTIGVSQLTTSAQHRPPPVTAPARRRGVPRERRHPVGHRRRPGQRDRRRGRDLPTAGRSCSRSRPGGPE